MTVTQSAYDLKENEFYPTEKWVTRALLRAVPELAMQLEFWEPSAGDHAIACVLKSLGASCWTSDIADYGVAHDEICDFFDQNASPGRVNIVSNPPYGRRNNTAVKYARHALRICSGYVALLLTAKIDSGVTRTDLFRDNDRFLGKVVLLDRISFERNGKGGTEDHAWYIWSPVERINASKQIFYERNEAARKKS